jgi:iron complex transport system permease protein
VSADVVLRAPAERVSLRLPARAVVVGGVLSVVVLVLLVASVAIGEFPISPGEVIAALLGGGSEETRFIVETLRLPRALTAVLVGGALAASGALFQSMTRNPLGSPDIVGFLQGASAAAVFQIIVLGGGMFAVAGASVAGGLITAAVVYALAFQRGVQSYRLILVGIGISAMLVAVTNLLLSRATLDEAASAQLWITGSLNGRGWEHVQPVAAALVVLLPLAFLLVRPLRTMELGDDAAHALGIRVEWTRWAVLVVAVGLCAVATASAGPSVFVALAAPQIARRLARASGPALGCAALTGAVLLLAADLLTRLVFPDRELPVGVATGVLGGIYLIALLLHEWRRGAR